MRRVNSAAGAAANLGRSAYRTVLGDFKNRAVGAALGSLKLWSIVLLSGVGFVLAAVAAPVLFVVFAMNVGISHGLRLDVPAIAVPPGPPLAPGELACPVPGATVTQSWGPSDLPGEPAMFGWPHFHTGVDLGIAEGTPIRAAEPGQVLEAASQTNDLGMLVGYGNLVRVQATTGRIAYYAHMSAFAVQRGDVVQTGQVIGFVGSTGYSTGPHVHFEVRVGGVPVNPAPYLRPC